MIKLTNISKSFNDYKALSNLSIEVGDEVNIWLLEQMVLENQQHSI